MTILHFVFFAQLLVMLSAFAVFVSTPPDLHTLALLFYLVIVAAVALLFALWQFVRYPARRRWALATAATPIICLTVPFLVTRLNGGPIHIVVLVVACVALMVAGLVMLLAQPGRWDSGGVFANKRLNIGLLIALAALLALYWLPIVGWLANQDSFSLPSDIGARDRVLRIASVYFASVAGPALLLSLFAVLYAPIGVARNAASRATHVGQLLFALLMLASLPIGVFALAIAMTNPG